MERSSTSFWGRQQPRQRSPGIIYSATNEKKRRRAPAKEHDVQQRRQSPKDCPVPTVRDVAAQVPRPRASFLGALRLGATPFAVPWGVPGDRNGSIEFAGQVEGLTGAQLSAWSRPAPE